MKMFLPVVAVLALAGGGADDLKRMEGSWTAIIQEASGKPASREDREKVKIKLAVRGQNYVVFFDDKAISQGVIRLDPTKKPAWVDAIPADGPHKGMVQPGIYEFLADGMRVVFAEPGQPRPAAFKTRPGSSEVLILYRKLK